MTAALAEPLRPSQGQGRRRSAFAALVRTEALLNVREIVPLLWGTGFPMVLLAVMGFFSNGPDQALGGISLVASYEPILIAFSIATFALQGVPVVLAGYRERGILRRLNATPVGAGRLLAAQLTVSLGLALVSVAGIVLLGRLAFGVALPGQPAGFCLALVLTVGAMLGLGLLVASLARTGRVAGAVGTMIFLPLMFFAGLWTPQATALLRAGRYTPLGAAVTALHDSMLGQLPSLSGLAVLAGYAVVLGLLAWRFFRWE